MSCKALKLSSCEIKGSTFAGRKFNFPNRDISEDTFVAKVRGFYNSQTIAEITGEKDEENNVYFSKATLENSAKGNYTIEYWATFEGIATELIAIEEFKISIDACDCGDSEDSTFTLTFPEETIEYSVEIAVINIGGGGDTSNLAKRNGTNITNPENWKALLGYVTDISGLATTTYVNETFQPIGNYLIASDLTPYQTTATADSKYFLISNANADNIAETATRVYLTPTQKAQIGTNTTAIANKNSLLETRANIATKLWTGTQAQYDSIVTKDSATLYFIQ